MLQRAVCHVTVSRQACCSILPGTVACMASYHCTSHAGLLLFKHCNSRGLIGECSICTELGPRSSSSPKLFRMCCRWGILPKHKEPDTAIVNVYDVEDCIPPHIDHHDFDRPFCTISLLSEQHIMFGSKIISRGPGDFVCDYEMPLPTGMHGSCHSRWCA